MKKILESLRANEVNAATRPKEGQSHFDPTPEFVNSQSSLTNSSLSLKGRGVRVNNDDTSPKPLNEKGLFAYSPIRLFTSKKAAFTLAEVLITLGIIGVVAAMTLPSLIQNYQDKQFKTAYKKAYSDVNAAFKFMIANDEYVTPQRRDNEGSTFFSEDENGFGNNLKTLSKYFKVTKTCYDNNAGECFVLDAQCGHANGAGGCPVNSYAFIDSSGRQWYMYSNSESCIIVDTNGNKKPNELGKDRFPLNFPIPTDTSGLYNKKMFIHTLFTPSYHYADITADENGDLTTKQRWCPSGKCYYSTWLLD